MNSQFICMHRIVLIIMMFIGVTTARAELANDGYLYRVDIRSPAEIFTRGFSLLGLNRNLLAHFSGLSFDFNGNPQDISAYISVTADYAHAVRYALDFSGRLHGRAVYVYTIRSTPFFYRADRVLTEILRQHQDIDVNTMRLHGLFALLGQESTWISSEQIPSELILESHQYLAQPNVRFLFDDDVPLPTPPNSLFNLSYIRTDPVVNSGLPHNLNEQEISLRPAYLVREVAPGVAVGMGATNYCAHAARLTRFSVKGAQWGGQRQSDSDACYITEKQGYFSYFLYEND